MGKKIRKKIGVKGDLYQVAHDTPMRILSLPVDDGGCGWYRVKQPLEFIRRFTSHDAHIIDKLKDNMGEVYAAFTIADIIVMRPGSEEGLAQILQIPELKNIKAKMVLDIDDNIEILSPYSFHYEEYGTSEVYDKNLKKWLWKDGVRGWNLKKNMAKLDRHLRGLKAVDLVTVTTPKLAEYAKQYNKNVAVLPNCINFNRWWSLPFRKNRQLRVGWSGGLSHYEDFYEIKEPLNELMRELKFKMVMVGSNFDGIFDDDNKHLVETHDWVPFKGHSYRMMCMNLDVAIVPLADLPFNHYKSAIKWYEMSAMGVPSVVGNFTPYKEEIENGVNALAYTTPKEFYTALKTLLVKSQVRKSVGKEALKWVKANRDAKKCANLWTDAYSKIIDK